MKKTIRVGMKVRSIYDPQHIFTLDRSKLPQRIFHEKGTSNWWTKNDLEAVSVPSKGKGAKPTKRAVTDRSQAFLGASGGLSPQAKRVYRRTCRECGVEFTTENRRKKFHADACRTAFWKRGNVIPAAMKERLRSEGRYGEQQEFGESLGDA